MKTKIECLLKMVSEQDQYAEIIEWIVHHKLGNSVEIRALTRDNEKAEFVYSTLRKAEKDEYIVLLDFEWQRLPIEYIKITIVTENESKEFTYQC